MHVIAQAANRDSVASSCDPNLLLGPFNIFESNDIDKSLPKLGPFEYPDGSIYYGQYKLGIRNGIGRQI